MPPGGPEDIALCQLARLCNCNYMFSVTDDKRTAQSSENTGLKGELRDTADKAAACNTGIPPGHGVESCPTSDPVPC